MVQKLHHLSRLKLPLEGCIRFQWLIWLGCTENRSVSNRVQPWPFVWYENIYLLATHCHRLTSEYLIFVQAQSCIYRCRVAFLIWSCHKRVGASCSIKPYLWSCFTRSCEFVRNCMTGSAHVLQSSTLYKPTSTCMLSASISTPHLSHLFMVIVRGIIRLKTQWCCGGLSGILQAYLNYCSGTSVVFVALASWPIQSL